MKILHIIDSLGLGGAQTFIKGLFETQKSNTDIMLYSLRSRDINIEIDHPNILRNTSTKKYSLSPIKKIRELIHTNKIDVLHATLFRAQVTGWIIKKFYCHNIKLVIHEQGQILGSDKNNKIEDFLYITFMRMIRNDVDMFIAVSNAMKDGLMTRSGIPESKIKVVYNFVNTNRFNINLKPALSENKFNLGINDGSTILIGFAARIIERKGWREFIEAAIQLNDYPGNLSFIVAGDGSERETMLKNAELITQGRFKYLGYYQDMPAFFSMLDIYVIPSHWEGLPLAQLEAMAMEVSMISSDGPGLSELPENNKSALITPVKDVKSLAEAMKKLISNTSLRSQLANNAGIIGRRYNQEYIKTQLDNLYKNLAI